MASLSARIANEIWPPLLVGLAAILFAIPAAAMIGFAILAAG